MLVLQHRFMCVNAALSALFMIRVTFFQQCVCKTPGWCPIHTHTTVYTAYLLVLCWLFVILYLCQQITFDWYFEWNRLGILTEKCTLLLFEPDILPGTPELVEDSSFRRLWTLLFRKHIGDVMLPIQTRGLILLSQILFLRTSTKPLPAMQGKKRKEGLSLRCRWQLSVEAKTASKFCDRGRLVNCFAFGFWLTRKIPH